MHENNADPGEIPPELEETLHDITQMEEMLCSLASPCFLMWVSKGGQYKSRGNVITFSQDISNLCTTLPHLPEQLDILLVRKPDAKHPSFYKDFRVRKKKVFDLLFFLKQHNPYYAHINIRRPEDVELPLDGNILDCVPSVVNNNSNANRSAVLNAVGNSNVDDGEDEFIPDELSQEQTSFVPSLLPGQSELQSIRLGLESNKLVAPSDHSVVWPPLGDALSEFSTDGLFSKAFPALFPSGKAEFSLSRKRAWHCMNG